MKNKWVGIVLIIVGIIMVAVDLLVEPLHLGSGDFGWKQITLLIVGLIIFIVGLVLHFAKRKGQTPD